MMISIVCFVKGQPLDHKMDENKIKKKRAKLPLKTVKNLLILSFKGRVFLSAIWLTDMYSRATKFEIQK